MLKQKPLSISNDQNLAKDFAILFMKRHQIIGLLFNHPNMTRGIWAAISVSGIFISITLGSLLQDFITDFNESFNVASFFTFQIIGFVFLWIYKSIMTIFNSTKFTFIFGWLIVGFGMLGGSIGCLFSTAHQSSFEFNSFHINVIAFLCIEITVYEVISTIWQILFFQLFFKAESKSTILIWLFIDPMVMKYYSKMK